MVQKLDAVVEGSSMQWKPYSEQVFVCKRMWILDMWKSQITSDCNGTPVVGKSLR